MLHIPRCCYGGWRRDIREQDVKEKKTLLSDIMLSSAVVLTGKNTHSGVSSSKIHIKDASTNWVLGPSQVWHQAMCREKGRLPISLPEYDVHRFQTGCDVGFGDLRSIRLQHVGLGGFHIWHGGCQPLPKAQEIVHAIWGKFPMLKKTKRVGICYHHIA